MKDFEGTLLVNDRSELVAITKRVAEAANKEKMEATEEVIDDGLQVQEE